MQIEDTFISVASVEIPENHTSEELAKFIGEAVTQIIVSAAASVRQKNPQHRTFALSACPVITGRLLVVTVITALVSKVALTGFPSPFGVKQ